MAGHLAYEFVPDGTGTLLIQRETLQLCLGLRPISPLIERLLRRHLHSRLIEIKDVLESGWDRQTESNDSKLRKI
jgi:hypothetical protein